MANIAVFVKNLTSGGAERQATFLAKLLCETGHKAVFVIFNGEKVHKKYIDYLDNFNIPVFLFFGKKKERFLQLRNFLREEKIDIVFSYLTAANFYAVRAAKGLPTKVVTGIRNAQLPFGKMLAECIITNFMADATVANSFCARDYFAKRGFNRKKISVIPNCIFASKSLRGDNADIIEVISVARFVPQKDYETAIRAFAKAYRVNPSLRYKIIGYGEDENKIRQLIKDVNCERVISIIINPPNIKELLCSADIYLTTSLFEGTSNSIMEALEAQLPVIATKVGDNSHLVVDNSNGYIVSIKDIDQISVYILNLSKDKDLRIKMGNNGYQHLVTNFSPEAFVERYARLINNLLIV